MTANKIFNRLRKETITFKNPIPELRKFLLSGGGTLKALASGGGGESIVTVESSKLIVPTSEPASNNLFENEVLNVVKLDKIKKKVN